MRIEQVFEETQLNENGEEVKSALEDIDGVIDIELFKNKGDDDKEDYNVSFRTDKEDAKYFVSPNEQGSEDFFIDADVEDFDTFKVKDIDELKKEVQKLV